MAARDEVLLYALHGVLHLCGYDDRTDRDFAAMHRREDEILERLGVGAIFRAGDGRRRSGEPAAEVAEIDVMERDDHGARHAAKQIEFVKTGSPHGHLAGSKGAPAGTAAPRR